MIADATPPLPASCSLAAYTRTDVRLSRALAALAQRGRVSLAALSLGLGVLTACGDPDSSASPMASALPDDTNTQVGRVPLEPTCVEGAVEPCHEMIGEHDGIVSCYAGTRTCTGGVVGACVDGETYAVVRGDAPAGSTSLSLRPLAISTATECTNNPCNSYCREFNEVPSIGGLAPDVDETQPPLSSWITGNASDYPPEWIVVGNREPCQVAGDCQFNTQCTDPSLGSCAHSVCGAGDTLAPGCNRCADTVCAINPDCCATPPTCAHDPCEVGNGAFLSRTCDACVAAVCDVHPECCDTTWNEACVGYVDALCAPLGQSCSCPGGSTVAADGTCYVAGNEPRDYFVARDACATFGTGWNLLEIGTEVENDIARDLVSAGSTGDAWIGGIETGPDRWIWLSTGEPFFVNDASGGALQGGYTYENWAAAEPALGTLGGYGITVGSDGEWRDADINLEFGYLCEGPKNRLGPQVSPFSWGPECVALAGRACGVSCSDGVPLGIGACSPRVPTALDATCMSFDLALGATCEAGGVPIVPVCNHGQLEAPAGLRLTHLPIAQIGSATPDFSDAGECLLTQAIPPGRCVSISDCPGLTADRALVVNPGALDPSECRIDDNWTIYQPLSCRPATCEANVYDAAQVQANGCGIDVQNPLGIDAPLARVTVGTSVPEPTCGVNEVRWGASCYFFSTDVDTWDDAQDRCRARGTGWDLVALNSEAENTWVRSQTDPGQDVQIGLNDKDFEGGHVWSNGSCFGFVGWDLPSAQPNNTPPGSEQCVRLTAASTAWEDKACNDGEHPFACEGPVLDARGGCAAGQVAGPDGHCYAFEPSSRSFADAQSTCLGMGPGWTLPGIDDATTNDFVTSLINCTPTWLDNPPGAFAHWKGGESVDLSNPPFIDSLGEWHADASTDLRATLCQGPATASGAPLLAQVANLGDCTGADEFYFGGSALAPETLQLCPATCAAAAAVPGRLVDVEIPCAPPKPPALVTEHSHVYEPTCPSGTPQWDFLYYDAITPADSRVEFEVRSALSPAELAANAIPFIKVGEAHAVPTDTQRCEVGPTGSGCPVDLYDALATAGQNQQVPVLELRVRLIPGSSGEGPVLRDWKIRFSCPPAQ